MPGRRYQREGLPRGYQRIGDTRRDMLVYALLAGDLELAGAVRVHDRGY